MFHQGDLQSGISLAIQEQKLVACFVRKDDEESTTWENDWFEAPMEDGRTIADALSDQAVLLKIEAGSQEAGFLSAFCSLEKVPKLVIISNGQVLENIGSGASKEEFTTRIASRVAQHGSHMPPAAHTSQPSTDTSQPVTDDPHPSAVTPEPNTVQVQPAADTRAPSQPTPDPNTVQAMMAERAARLAKSKQQKEQAEKEARKAAAKARKEQEEKEAAGHNSSTQSSRQAYVDQQRTRLKEAKQEKERVLKMIEADKAARKERDAQRKLAAQGEATPASGPSTATGLGTNSRPSGHVSALCSLQIRLFDGSSIRTKFASDSTLSSAVRTYVTEESQTFQPYNFRLMQVPGPSRTIDISEENQSLQSLGLCPSATLVLVPVKEYTTAYSGTYSNSIMNRSLAMTQSVMGGAYNLVGGMLGRLTGYGAGEAEGPYMGGTADEQEPSNVQGSRMAGADSQPQTGPSSGMKIRTLADQRRDDQSSELYNGNQLNFEPRKDDDKKD
ncbi:hypothetical protein MBLNU457_4188t1 [Dothideomycetes sp. NU457]